MRRPRFSEMLLTRRRQLGLTTSQASKILRLREDVLIAFEEGDFEKMPQSGYAQGMLSSYARYLGLNPRQVTDLFQEELYEFVNGSSSHELRRRTRDVQSGRGVGGYEVVNEQGSRPKAYVEYHGLLPTSGGPAGDMGAFATTTSARPRRSVPLAGSGPSAAEAYGSQSYDTQSYGAGSYGNENPRGSQRRRRPYNGNGAGETRQSSRGSQYERQRRRNMQQRRGESAADRLLSDDMRTSDATYGTRGGLYRRDDVSTRNIIPREYTDDMRFDDRADPYERASTISGRRSSRNIANMERPNVRRGSGPGAGSRGRGSASRQSGRGRRSGGIAGFFSDPQRAIFAIVLLLAVVLTAILVFSVSSCVNGKQRESSLKSVAVSSTDSGTSSSTSTSTTGSSGSSSSSSAGSSKSSTSGSSSSASTTDSSTTTSTTTDSTTSQSSTYVPTVVKVSVESGSYTWLEVTSDGVSDVAESVTGPWEHEYTVTDSITVQAGDPSSVTVTKNGEAVSFTSKASGLGSLSIKGTKPPETTSEDSKTTAEGSDATTAAGTATDAGTDTE